MENGTIKMKELREKHLKNTVSNQFLKAKYSLIGLEKDFIELNDVELKDRETKIKREIGKLFFKPNNITIDDMDRLEKIEMEKIRSIKNTWLDWLINYIPEPIAKSVSALNNKIGSLYKSITLEQTVYGRGQKLSKPRKWTIKKSFISEENKEKIKDRITRDIWKLFETEEEKEERKVKD